MDFPDPLSGIGFPRNFPSDSWVQNWWVVGFVVVYLAWSFPLAGLVDTLDPSSYIMQPTPAHTRARTLQERLGTQQNGSTSVRSSGRLAVELIPDQRENVDEANFEGEYSDEMRRLGTFMDDDFYENDYELEMCEKVDGHSVTTCWWAH